MVSEKSMIGSDFQKPPETRHRKKRLQSKDYRYNQKTLNRLVGLFLLDLFLDGQSDGLFSNFTRNRINGHKRRHSNHC